MRVHFLPDRSFTIDFTDPAEAMRLAQAWATGALPTPGAAPEVNAGQTAPPASVAAPEPVMPKEERRPKGPPQLRMGGVAVGNLTLAHVLAAIKVENTRTVYDEFVAAGPTGASLREIAKRVGLGARYPGVFISSINAVAKGLGVPRTDILQEMPAPKGWYVVPLTNQIDTEEGPG